MGKDYMTQLSRWARWMLPWQEADVVIADYRDITGIPPRSREELLRDLVRARTGDRRWAAVYVLAITALLISRVVLEWSHLPVITNPEEKFRQLMLRCTIAAAAGMAGTGAALC